MSSEKIQDFVELCKEMVLFIRMRKAYWLAPLIFILLLLGAFFVVLEGSVMAPLIYTIF